MADVLAPPTFTVTTEYSFLSGDLQNPSTPNQHDLRFNGLGKLCSVSEPTMEPEIRKTSNRTSPKVPHSRKSLVSPSNVNVASTSKRSGVKSSDYRGVSKCAKDGRWQSRIRVGKKVKYLGRFKTEEAAAARYDEAALALHGRRATLNFELSEVDLEAALSNIATKRAEFGFDEADINEYYSPRASTSRGSSRSTSPSQVTTAEDDDEIDVVVDPTTDDQNAAIGLMWLKLSLNPNLS